ncbi:hypothetical protein G9C85_08660 [Halorubellus sp. JP-L1]|uniref:DUF7119 family protein n=1 Tax=Halorubellus sp. JP-L1 TaxID=2715753 RepID=UPI00140E059B|nr:hypothetical protein [Halorubellus sp. JP-L1]NHN41703.1 hypothetical protein [Halorubellus sp. JP-L1]
MPDEDVPRADRTSPVGKPVIRGDPAITGQTPEEAVQFDPDDPESVALAADTVARFATSSVGDDDHVYVLRGAAACAALVRGVGSYKTAAERTDGAATVSFIRKWARVHDLPREVRLHVARGDIAPTAAKHVARLAGEARFLLAWAVLDADLTVRDVRSIASAVDDDTPIDAALRDHDVHPGHLDVDLPLAAYTELRRQAAAENRTPGSVLADALAAYDPERYD